MINFSIILADDEQQILFGMKNGIDWESLGFSVVGTAQNGKEALELIEEYHPDLLISDIKCLLWMVWNYPKLFMIIT